MGETARLLPTRPYRGTRDMLPKEMSQRTEVFQRLFETVERYGHARYDAPAIEPVEIYEAKSGRELVDKQLFTLTDRGGRRLALRPEMTPSVARMVAANLGEVRLPLRWYSHVTCYRYERPQRGRTREHWQLNVDVFGAETHHCEIELFELIHDLMGAVGATGDAYEIRANDRVVLDLLLIDFVGLNSRQLPDVRALVDRWPKLTSPQRSDHAQEIGVTGDQLHRLEELVNGGVDLLERLPDEARAGSPLLQVLADKPGLVRFDPGIVRGLDYYTSTVFEVFDRSPANRRSLFGGGRYADLTGLFSRQRVPGVGFALGDVTLFDFLATHDLLPTPTPPAQITVIPVDVHLVTAAQEIAQSLRRDGLRTATVLEPGGLGDELRNAADADSGAAVIVGDEGLAQGLVTIRDLARRTQQDVGLPDVAREAQKILRGQSR